VESNLWVMKGTDIELEEHSNSSGLCERRSRWERLFAEGQFASEWYQSLESFLSEAGKGITPCRREEKGNRLIEKTGMLEEGVDQQGTQK
jgi:hypothetical protein